MNIVCQFCGKEKISRRKSAKFCSKECSSKYRVGTKLLTDPSKKHGKNIQCRTCGKDKYYPPSAIKRGGGKFCSNKCMTASLKGTKRTISDEHRGNIKKNHHCVSGKNNPNYRGGIAKGRTKWQNRNWKNIKSWRNFILNRDGNKCKICGSTSKIEVHHIIPISETYLTSLLPMNGVTLCHSCHKKTDSFGGGARFEKKIEDGIGKPICLMRVIPNEFQSYETIGNWSYTEDGLLVIFVSKQNSEHEEMLIFIHEFIEAILCRKAGITQQMVDDFDMGPGAYDKIPEGEESGDQPDAPYRRQHRFACLIEYMLAHEMGLDGYGRME